MKTITVTKSRVKHLSQSLKTISNSNKESLILIISNANKYIKN